MDTATDEELMDRFCLGDEVAFDLLFERHGPALQTFLNRMVRDRALAEDLLQVTFLSMVRSRDRFERGAKVAPWLFSIAANAARDALRRHGRQTGMVASLTPAVAEAPPPSADPGMAQQIATALDELPTAQREAVVLHRVMGWSFEEVAKALGTSATAARIRASRGYERLKQRLGHLLEDE